MGVTMTTSVEAIRRPANGLPIEGAWICPGGERIPVVEHLPALQRHLWRFGLSDRDVRGASLEQLRAMAVDLIAQGWTRYRYLDGVHRLEVADLRGTAAAFALLADRGWMDPWTTPARERVVISLVSPRVDLAGKVGDTPERLWTARRPPGRQNRWRFS
jgi:hypothetical protein